MDQGQPGRLKREVLVLAGLVLAVHAIFIAGYYLADVPRRPAGFQRGYAAAWTVVTLLVVLRGLTRLRAQRIRRLRGPRE